MCGHIKKIANYALRHYSCNRYIYYALMLGTFGVPLLYGYASHSAVSAAMLAASVALFDLLFVLYLSTFGLRSKPTFVVENTLPISVAERYTFIMLNSTVVAILLFVVCFIPAMAIMKAIFPPVEAEEFMLSELVGDLRLSLGTLATHAILLVVNLTARMRVIMNYLVAIGLIFIGKFLIQTFVPHEYIVEVRTCINVLVIIVGWVLGYFILRYKDIKL